MDPYNIEIKRFLMVTDKNSKPSTYTQLCLYYTLKLEETEFKLRRLKRRQRLIIEILSTDFLSLLTV